MRKENEEHKQYILLGILVLVVITFLFGSFRVIDAGENGVRVTLGKASLSPLNPGIHFKFPLIQTIVKFETRTQKYEAELSASSRDLQEVSTKVAINYKVDPSRTPEIYKTLGTEYANRIIYPIEQEVNKASTAQFTAEELVTKRESVREMMRSNLKEKLLPRGIIVEEISIINFEFGEEFTKAIEQKQVAEQQALTAENKFKEMEWTSKSMKLQSEVLEIKKLDIQQQWITKWDGKLPIFMTNGDGMLINFNPKELVTPTT